MQKTVKLDWPEVLMREMVERSRKEMRKCAKAAFTPRADPQKDVFFTVVNFI